MGKKTYLIIAIMAMLIGLFMVPFGLAQDAHDTGENIGEGSGSGGTIGSVPTTDNLDGLTIPYPDTAIGYEQPACDGAIIGGASSRIDEPRNEQCEGRTSYFGRNTLSDGKSANTGNGELGFSPSTPSQAKWYMNEPWGGGTSGCSNVNPDYKHKKVVISSKSSGKSVVASIEECGPNISTVTAKRRAGASPQVLSALGWTSTDDSRNLVNISFASDQSVALGPVTAAQANILANGNVPDFKQTDSRWASIKIKGFNDTMYNIGCAITALADVLSANGASIDPGQLVRTANGLGIANRMKGSDGLYAYMAKKYGLVSVQLNPATQWEETMTYLKQGGLIIANGKGPAPFTEHGHYVVFTSYNSDGTITVNDPYRSNGPANYAEALLKEYSTKNNGYISIFYKK